MNTTAGKMIRNIFDDSNHSNRFLKNLKTSDSSNFAKKCPMVAAVILNLDAKNHVQELLQSLYNVNRSSFNLEVVVVDNGSKDGSVAAIRHELKKFHLAHLIVNRKNLGSSHGRNQALKYLLERTGSKRPDYILTIDNDVVIEPQVIADLVCQA